MTDASSPIPSPTLSPTSRSSKTKAELLEEMAFTLDKLEVLEGVIDELAGDFERADQTEVLRSVAKDLRDELMARTAELCSLYPLALP